MNFDETLKQVREERALARQKEKEKCAYFFYGNCPIIKQEKEDEKLSGVILLRWEETIHCFVTIYHFEFKGNDYYPGFRVPNETIKELRSEYENTLK